MSDRLESVNPATGAALRRAAIDKPALTGSTATGKKVMATCAETLTPVIIEAGGKDARLVDELTRGARDVHSGTDAGAHYGPMTMAGQPDVVRRHIGDAVARGAEQTFGPTVTVDKVRDMDEAVARRPARRADLLPKRLSSPTRGR